MRKINLKVKLLLLLADLLILAGIAIIFMTFASPIYQQARYQLNRVNKTTYILKDDPKIASNAGTIEKQKVVEPINKEFGIFIPKIGANAKIFPEIDPFDEKVFLPILRKGVAHAKGTAYPGQIGNTYLFAHSTDAFFNFGRYNAVFYLIGELEKGDEIDVYYQNQLYIYIVSEKKVVPAESVKYLLATNNETLTLQTCYPPGTTLKRLIVTAKPSSTN